MSIKAVQIQGPQDQSDPNSPTLTAEIERHSQHLVMKGDIHAQIHKGIFFSVGVADAALANGSLLQILIQTPTGAPLHVRFTAALGGTFRAGLFEGVTFSAAGTTITPLNRNRRSGNTAPRGTYTTGPTITTTGTTLFDGYAPGGSGGNAVGGSLSSFEEYILASSTNYLARITNVSGQAQVATLSMDFYDTGLTPYA